MRHSFVIHLDFDSQDYAYRDDPAFEIGQKGQHKLIPWVGRSETANLIRQITQETEHRLIRLGDVSRRIKVRVIKHCHDAPCASRSTDAAQSAPGLVCSPPTM